MKQTEEEQRNVISTWRIAPQKVNTTTGIIYLPDWPVATTENQVLPSLSSSAHEQVQQFGHQWVYAEGFPHCPIAGLGLTWNGSKWALWFLLASWAIDTSSVALVQDLNYRLLISLSISPLPIHKHALLGCTDLNLVGISRHAEIIRNSWNNKTSWQLFQKGDLDYEHGVLTGRLLVLWQQLLLQISWCRREFLPIILSPSALKCWGGLYHTYWHNILWEKYFVPSEVLRSSTAESRILNVVICCFARETNSSHCRALMPVYLSSMWHGSFWPAVWKGCLFWSRL